MITTNYAGDPYDDETITPTSATGITLALLKATDGMQARAAFIQVEDNTINYTITGTVPTNKAGTNAGHALLAGESVMLIGAVAVKNFSCVDRVAASASIVKITVFK